MKFETPQINLFNGEDIEVSRKFYEKLGFKVRFTAEFQGRPSHYEMLLDDFNLGISTREAARKEHGLNPGENQAFQLVLWADDTDGAIQFLVENGASILTEPHDFRNLRTGTVLDPNGNQIQIVSRNERS